MAVQPQKWRVAKLKKHPKTGEPYFGLRTGRNKERVTLSLGYVTEDEANRACVTLQGDADAGRVQRVLNLYDESRDKAIAYLVGEDLSDLADIFGPEKVNHSRLTLSDYVRTYYGPARAAKRPGAWETEGGGASCPDEPPRGYWRRILSEIGTVRLGDVDEFTAADYVDGLVCLRGPRMGEPASGNTKRLHKAAIAACLKWAYRQRHIPVLPNLAVFEVEGSTKTVLEKVDPFSLDELAAMMDTDTSKTGRVRCMLAVGAGLGPRPDELVSMRWEDINWADRLVTLRGSKTKLAGDTVPLTPIAYRELQAFWLRLGQPSEGPCFTWGGKQIKEYKSALETAAAKAGVKRARIYPYLLRHSFATIAWCVGLERDVTRRIGRWTDTTMLDRVYARPRPQDLARKVAKFDFAS